MKLTFAIVIGERSNWARLLTTNSSTTPAATVSQAPRNETLRQIHFGGSMVPSSHESMTAKAIPSNRQNPQKEPQRPKAWHEDFYDVTWWISPLHSLGMQKKRCCHPSFKLLFSCGFLSTTPALEARYACSRESTIMDLEKLEGYCPRPGTKQLNVNLWLRQFDPR